MKSLWNDREAAQFVGDLSQRIYTSHLIGRDRSLVLHGGGNTSVKISTTNIFGENEDILYIKGSGSNLETIESSGFSPCRMSHLLRLAKLDSLSDAEMVREFRASMIDFSAPMPSVEAMLHAILRAKFVDHTHADVLISIMNTSNGIERVREIFGDRIVIIPYVMPGFNLAKSCAECLSRQAGPTTVGMVLMNHGLFTFGETARASYECMIEMVDQAEGYLKKHSAWNISFPNVAEPKTTIRFEVAKLRHEVSIAAGKTMIAAVRSDAICLGFARRPDVLDISRRGAATPDHVIRTKSAPLVGRDIAAFRRSYEHYFEAHAAGRPMTKIDPAPRLILDGEIGLLAFGCTAKDADVARDIYCHTIEIILRAEALGGWQPLPEADLFNMEYWDLQQAKLRPSSEMGVFAGEIALVTGAASGIGRACVESLLRRGAAVVGLDVSPEIINLHCGPDFKGIVCDLTEETDVFSALEKTVRAFGGLDMLILSAGIFPKGRQIAETETELWRKVMSLNLDANFVLMRDCHPLLKLAPRGGRVVVIGSKNVPAPGPGAAAYSASKAAVNQLVRVAALEWGKDRIRINSIHPNMVFDTAIWTSEVLESRAKHYGLTVEAYKTKNVLGVEITSRDVAELAAEMCGPLFAKTTAAQIPVDGGNERVI